MFPDSEFSPAARGGPAEQAPRLNGDTWRNFASVAIHVAAGEAKWRRPSFLALNPP
jgi:hypothetical protein